MGKAIALWILVIIFISLVFKLDIISAITLGTLITALISMLLDALDKIIKRIKKK